MKHYGGLSYKVANYFFRLNDDLNLLHIISSPAFELSALKCCIQNQLYEKGSTFWD